MPKKKWNDLMPRPRPAGLTDTLRRQLTSIQEHINGCCCTAHDSLCAAQQPCWALHEIVDVLEEWDTDVVSTLTLIDILRKIIARNILPDTEISAHTADPALFELGDLS